MVENGKVGTSELEELSDLNKAKMLLATDLSNSEIGVLTGIEEKEINDLRNKKEIQKSALAKSVEKLARGYEQHKVDEIIASHQVDNFFDFQTLIKSTMKDSEERADDPMIKSMLKFYRGALFDGEHKYLLLKLYSRYKEYEKTAG